MASSKTIKGNDLARAIVDTMREYSDEVAAAVRKEVDDAAEDIKTDIQARSPRKTGRYAKGWHITKRDTKGVTSRIVHNKDVPGLPHLLERGHAKRGGERVAGTPHVAPASEPRLQRMFENIKRIIQSGGQP